MSVCWKEEEKEERVAAVYRVCWEFWEERILFVQNNL